MVTLSGHCCSSIPVNEKVLKFTFIAGVLFLGMSVDMVLLIVSSYLICLSGFYFRYIEVLNLEYISLPYCNKIIQISGTNFSQLYRY